MIVKLTKYIHSCVLVETPDRVGLFDPGQNSWASGSLDISKIDRLDRIIITHSHRDHYSPDFVKALLYKFPEVHIVTNKDVEKTISDDGIEAIIREDTSCTHKFKAFHAQVPFPNIKDVENTGYHFKNIFTHPGDSNTFAESKTILAMPFVAPWGLVRDAYEKVLELHPKYVLPIHDWFYSDEGNSWLQTIMKPLFEEQGIILLNFESGETLSLDV